MLKLESEKKHIFQTLENKKIIKKALVLMLKRTTHQKHDFFYENLQKH